MRKIFGIIGLIQALTMGAAIAGPIAEPAGKVVLTISGDIANTNQESSAVFDIEMLKNLPALTYKTDTIWTDGEKTFVGVPLAALMDAVDASATSIKASAINDYTVEIPADTVTPISPMVAYEMDGAAMSRRQKGPLWIVYPYSTDSAYRAEIIYNRSIWQLDRLEFVK